MVDVMALRDKPIKLFDFGLKWADTIALGPVRYIVGFSVSGTARLFGKDDYDVDTTFITIRRK